jgi:uncharacterized protein YjbI with pentapeptide repeats
MANPEHLEILRLGVERWNHWRKQNPRIERPELDGAELAGIQLKLADLSGANLVAANLAGANLVAADLYQANLSNALFAKADLDGAHLSKANLSEASLNGATLIGANLNMAFLRGADLTSCTVGWTLFAYVDLSELKGLETVHHQGPSTIGVDTIYRSGGRIPETFLRGAGVPSEFIAYIGSMVGRAIEFYSCFISYSGKDQQFAQRLYNDLQGNKIRCWFAPHDIKGGRKVHDQIDEAIRLHDKLLLILSEHSIKSEWVNTEIAKARKREGKEGKRLLFPVRLVDFESLRGWECFDADTGKDSAREIREYFIPDFSDWKDHDAYQKAFQRLVADLKADTSK